MFTPFNEDKRQQLLSLGFRFAEVQAIAGSDTHEIILLPPDGAVKAYHFALDDAIAIMLASGLVPNYRYVVGQES